MTDPGPDGSGVGAAARVGDPPVSQVSPGTECAEDRDAKGLQDHGDSGADEAAQAWEAERVAQQLDFLGLLPAIMEPTASLHSAGGS